MYEEQDLFVSCVWLCLEILNKKLDPTPGSGALKIIMCCVLKKEQEEQEQEEEHSLIIVWIIHIYMHIQIYHENFPPNLRLVYTLRNLFLTSF